MTGGSQGVGGGGGESSLATPRAFPFDRVPMYGGSATEESGSIDLIRGLLERCLFVARVDESEEKSEKPKNNGIINERT